LTPDAGKGLEHATLEGEEQRERRQARAAAL
jgi:hypothetical protein